MSNFKGYVKLEISNVTKIISVSNMVSLSPWSLHTCSTEDNIGSGSVSEVNFRRTAHMAGHCIWRPRTFWVNVVLIASVLCSSCRFTSRNRRTVAQRRRWRYGPYSVNGRRLFSASPAPDAGRGGCRRKASFYEPRDNRRTAANTWSSAADVW